jgi:hypothetical protein
MDCRVEPGTDDQQDEAMRWLLPIVIAGCMFNFAARPAMADEIKFCTSGTMTLGPFAQHIAEIRKARRYEPEEIKKLIADERKGGPEFFSSQVVIKEEQSGSGDFDLHLFQGFSDPQAKYTSVQKWHCESGDYPVAYFVGFKVREIGGGAILVTREKGTVNVISLKKLDPDLAKPVSVKDFESHAVLCQDIAKGCVKTIFYGRY